MKTLLLTGGILLFLMFLSPAKKADPSKPDDPFMPDPGGIEEFASVEQAKDHTQIWGYAKVEGFIYQKQPDGTMKRIGGVA